jgi:4-amino-4-deoxy-L-arabinose transferase-like glycosyltransferase
MHLIAPPLNLIPFIVGFVTYILIPGMVVKQLLSDKFDGIGYSIIAGILLQFSIGFGFFLLIPTIVSETVVAEFYIVSTCFSIVIASFALPSSFSLKTLVSKVSRSSSRPITLFFFVAIIARLSLALLNNASVMPDAALYLDHARSAIQNGGFVESVLNDEAVSAFQEWYGLVPHIGIVFGFISSFLISGISTSSAIYWICLVSATLVYPLVDISRQIFGRRSAYFAALIVSFLPITFHFSALLYGPEILSTFFATVASILLLRGLKQDNRKYLYLAGLLLGITEMVWWFNFYPVLAFFVFMIGWTKKDTSRSTQLVMTSLIIGVSLILWIVNSLLILLIFMVFLVVVSGLLKSFKRLGLILQASVLSLGMITINITQSIRQEVLSAQMPFIHPSVPAGENVGILQFVRAVFDSGILKNTAFIDWMLHFGYSATPFILFLGVMGLIRWKHPAYSLSMIMMLIAYGAIQALLIPALIPTTFNPGYFMPTNRYFLLQSVWLVPAAGFGGAKLVSILKKHLPDYRSIAGMPLPNREKLSTIILVTLIIAPSIPFQVQGIVEMNRQDVLWKFGWRGTVDWLKENADHEEILLAARPRELMWLTNIKCVTVLNRTIGPMDKVNISVLKDLAISYSADYLIADRYLRESAPQLGILFDSELSIEDFLVLPTQIDHLSNISTTIGYQLVYEVESSQGLTRIFRIVEGSIESTNIWSIRDWQTGWIAGNGGNLEWNESGLTLTIGESRNYTYTLRNIPFDLDIKINSSLIIEWNINWYTITNARMEIWTSDGVLDSIVDLKVSDQIGRASVYTNTIGDIRIVIEGLSGSKITIEDLDVWDFSFNVEGG